MNRHRPRDRFRSRNSSKAPTLACEGLSSARSGYVSLVLILWTTVALMLSGAIAYAQSGGQPTPDIDPGTGACQRSPPLSEREWHLVGTAEYPVTINVSSRPGWGSLTISGTLCDEDTGEILSGASGEVVRFEGTPRGEAPALSEFDSAVVSVVETIPFSTSPTGQFKIVGLKPGSYTFLLQSAGPRGRADQTFLYDMAWSHGFTVTQAYRRF